MNLDTLKETIRQELPELLRLDPDFRSYIIEIARGEFADRKETGDWFHETLDEMRRERERQDKKWDKHSEEEAKKWDKHSAEEAKKWKLHVEEEAKKWKLNVEEEAKKWDQNKEEFNRVHEEIMAVAKKQDRSIGALGARWGMQSERSFRNALTGILEKNFGVEVINVNEYDEQGVVFGRPDQIELDVIIKNGMLLICELKSSIDKAGMHIFERKARFYESRHNRKADRLIVISPMIDPKAQKLAERLHIETYSDSLYVESLDDADSVT
ncbi:MAG: DUF3782 domain-containing protein [Proteobacteria bacterium]|nr:DUF3782 domain-containing protein [Pseudomonadota bacterium]